MKRTLERLRRAKRMRATAKRLLATRMSVHRSNQHIYAQLIDPTGNVLAAASTLMKEFRAEPAAPKKKSDAAAWVGDQIAKKAISLGIKKIAFDRSGFKYHGCVLRLADAARAAGLEF